MYRRELEIRRRIRVAVAAFSYEIEADSIMTDAQYDELARLIDVTIDTGNATLDKFFRNSYNPDSGMWIHHHPELGGIIRIYDKHFRDRERV